MKRTDQIHLPPKKRRFDSAFVEPETEDQRSRCENPVNGNAFLYPPNKRVSPCVFESEFELESKLIPQREATSSATDDLNALFEYIRITFLTHSDSDEEWVQSIAKKKMKMKKKKRQRWKYGLKWALTKWRKQRMVMGLKKEKVKDLFVKLWIGNEKFKWEIEHYTDPLSFPPRTWP